MKRICETDQSGAKGGSRDSRGIKMTKKQTIPSKVTVVTTLQPEHTQGQHDHAPFQGKVVARSLPKIDGMLLAQGKPLFVADIKMDGMLHAKVLWSPHAHARIKRIDVSKAER